jgi:hypothetical protein
MACHFLDDRAEADDTQRRCNAFGSERASKARGSNSRALALSRPYLARPSPAQKRNFVPKHDGERCWVSPALFTALYAFSDAR